MATVNSYQCDICAKRRDSDANNWLVLLAPESEPMLVVYRWGDDRAAQPMATHACGFDHASQLFARWLSKGSL